jgi:hypothetical protein
MDFQKGRSILVGRCLGNLCRVEAEVVDGVFERQAVGIFQLEQCGIESSGDRTASEKRNPEAYTLLFREGDHFDGDRQLHFTSDQDEFKRKSYS